MRQDSRIIGGVCILVGAGLMLFGLYRGELTIMVTKAINICLECIGIG